jgi:hypothetical protein
MQWARRSLPLISATGCAANSVIPHQLDASPPSEAICGILPRTPAEIAAARAYVVETAQPGYTMTRQGPELAVSRLHPEFVVRLASAIREAREAGLAFAGVFSAYRPPAFGVGGFANKFHSLHAYGLAVDLYGIGRLRGFVRFLRRRAAGMHSIFGARRRRCCAVALR